MAKFPSNAFFRLFFVSLLSAVAVAVPVLPSPSASVRGDPHYTGFDGTRYDFNGFSGGHFNFYSDPSHQINTLFDNMGMKGLTFIKELGIKCGSNTTKIAIRAKPFVTENGQARATLDVEVNGMPLLINENGTAVSILGGVQIRVSHASSGMDSVTVITPSLKIRVAKDGLKALHLDVALDVIAAPSNLDSVHGSLGQTLRWKDMKEGEAMLEGDETDYLVSGLFDDDFTFNKFSGQDFQMTTGNRKVLA